MTPPEQSEAPKALRPPVVPPAGPPSAPESAPRGTGADAAASADTPSIPERPAPPANPSAPAAPAADTVPAADAPDQVAVLQTVVEKLATPTTKAATRPRSGYTPRVFAFDRPPKSAPGSSSTGSQGTRPQDTTTPATTPAPSTAEQAPDVTDPNKTPGETADAAPAASTSSDAASAPSAKGEPEAATSEQAPEAPARQSATSEQAAPAKATSESAAPESAEAAKTEPGTAAPDEPAPAKAEPEKSAAAGAAAAASTAAGAAAAAAGTAPAAGSAASAGEAAAASAAAAPPVLPAPPPAPPRSLIPQSGAVPPPPGGVPSPGPGTVPAPPAGQNAFLKPLTGAIQRVSRPLSGTRWSPVRADATPLAASEQGPAGPNGPGRPGGTAGPAGPAGPGFPGGGPQGPGAPGAPTPAGQGSFYGLAGDGAPSRGPKVALFAVLAAVVLFGIYALVAWTQSDTVPGETTVAGVDVGGLTQAEAASALTEQLAPRIKEPIALTAGEGKAQLSPKPSGLAIDAEATAADLTGFSLSPMRMWAHMFGGSEEELVLDIDDKKFSSAVAGLEDSLAVDPVDGTVGFVDGQAVKTDPEDGSRIVASETARIIKERWINEKGPFDLPVEAVAPTITQQQTDESFAVAQKIVSAPVTVSVGDQKPVLTPEVLSGLIRFEQRKDQLAIIVDKDATVAAIVDGTTNLLEVPDDAHFEFVSGRPTVVGGKSGTTLDADEAAKAVRIAATTDDRETSVELVEQDPKETVESLKKLGVKEVISEFSTPLTNEPVRTQNLVRGAEMITGNLVKPGETFSLLEALAPITLENGYFDAGVVENGEHVEAVGGGLSQMATTSFNAGFFAGYDDVEHHAHSYWFPRYPMGREATIYVGAKDMKFTNDTPYGAVMQAFVSGGELTVRIWSTKYYTVQESTSPRTNIVPKTTIHDSSPDCEPYPGGEDGFSVTISRTVLHNGQVAKENSFSHSYNPDNPVVCDKPQGSKG